MAVRKILIVEDQALARTYLCSCVEKCSACEVAGTLSKADAALYQRKEALGRDGYTIYGDGADS